MSALQANMSGNLRLRLKGVAAEPRGKTPLWSRMQLAGRLCELSSIPGSALLTAAFRLVLDAQMEGEPVAWITAMPDTFFPPGCRCQRCGPECPGGDSRAWRPGGGTLGRPALEVGAPSA